MTERKAVQKKQSIPSSLYYGVLVGGTSGFFWIWTILFLGWLYSKLSGENIHSLAVKLAIGGGFVLFFLSIIWELSHEHEN